MIPLLLFQDYLGFDELERRRTRRLALPPTDPADWKAGLALEIEILLFITLVFGIDHCGLLTLIFERRRGVRPITPAEAQLLFKNAWRHLLPKFFVAYIAVLDFHRSGKIHLHLVVALRINIRAGWDFGIDEQHRALQKLIRDERRRATPEELKQLRSLSRHLTTKPEVKSIWRQLRVGLKALGFASAYPFELKPVREPRKLACYLTRRFRESKAARHLRPAYCHCRRFSHRYKRHVDQKLRFSAVGPSATLYRRKKAAVGRAFGIDDIGQMIQEFGSSWEHKFGEILRPINPCEPNGFFGHQWLKLDNRLEDWRKRYRLGRYRLGRLDRGSSIEEDMARYRERWPRAPKPPPLPSETPWRVPA